MRQRQLGMSLYADCWIALLNDAFGLLREGPVEHEDWKNISLATAFSSVTPDPATANRTQAGLTT